MEISVHDDPKSALAYKAESIITTLFEDICNFDVILRPALYNFEKKVLTAFPISITELQLQRSGRDLYASSVTRYCNKRPDWRCTSDPLSNGIHS